jgi:mannose-6-phosphate isomerase
LEKLLVFANVQKGDVLYVPAGTIHALGPGLLIYEIQQASDITYRLYDWGRMGLDGNPRPLHIEKSITVSNMDSLPPITHPDSEKVVEGDYFVTLRHTLDGKSISLDTDGKVFHVLTCIQGEVSASANDMTVAFCKGQTVTIPAAVGQYGLNGTGQILNSMQR